jgi:hypothetical protein
MNTIVSAFFSNINVDKPIDKYIEYGKKLINIQVNKIIFIEKVIYDKYNFEENIFTKYIFIKKEDNYLFQFTDLKNYGDLTNKKDTIEYYFIQCHKTEWLKQAILLNPFNTTSYVWVDFGLYHVIKDDEILKNEIIRISNKEISKVYIASIWNLEKHILGERFLSIPLWYFAGGVISGDIKSLLLLAEYMKKECLLLIKNKKCLIFEVNILYKIWLLYPDLFNTYKCNHDKTILTNF